MTWLRSLLEGIRNLLGGRSVWGDELGARSAPARTVYVVVDGATQPVCVYASEAAAVAYMVEHRPSDSWAVLPFPVLP
jgi:hypothetical protein